jgi:hypothetical protein
MKTYIIQVVIALAFISAILAETSASKKSSETPICATDSGTIKKINDYFEKINYFIFLTFRV